MRRALAVVAFVGTVSACGPDPSDVPVPTTDVPATTEAAAATTAIPTTQAPTTEAATTEPPTTIGGSLPAGVTVSVEYVPNLALLRSLEVHVDNSASSDLAVAVAARTPGFEAVDDPSLLRVISAGLAQDIEVALGDAICPAGPGTPVVAVTITSDEGSFDSTSAIPDPERLQQLNDRECGQRAVFERASVALGEAPVVDVDALTTTIDLTRVGGDDPITITETGGTLLFQVLPDGGPPGALVTMAPGATSAALTVRMSNTRCDAHVVSQSQLSYRFPVWVQIGDGEPQYIFLTPGPVLRAALEALVQQCLATEGSGAQGT